MTVRFYTQSWIDRTEFVLIPTVAVIKYHKGWAIGIAWLKWSVSFCFGRDNHDGTD